MKKMALIVVLLLPCPAKAQSTYCSKIGDSVSCQDYEAPNTRQELYKLDKDSWEYRRGVEKLEQERKARIAAKVEEIQKQEIQNAQDAEDRRRQEKELGKMLGKNNPVKVDADGFYE